MSAVFFRTLFVYAAVIGGLRFAGKRQLGELSTSEFAVTILVSELATIPLQDSAVPLLGGIIPLATLLSIEIVVSCLCRSSRRARHILCGNPCIVIRDGKFVPQMLRSLRLSPEDILESLRLSGIINIHDVRYAIVETNGQLSIIPYADLQPLTPSDVRLTPEDKGISHILIENGTVISEELQQLNKSVDWLLQQCRRHGAKSFADVYCFTVDDCGNQFFQLQPQRGDAS